MLLQVSAPDGSEYSFPPEHLPAASLICLAFRSGAEVGSFPLSRRILVTSTLTHAASQMIKQDMNDGFSRGLHAGNAVRRMFAWTIRLHARSYHLL